MSSTISWLVINQCVRSAGPKLRGTWVKNVVGNLDTNLIFPIDKTR